MRGKTVAILESRFGEQLADLVSKRGGHPLRAPALAEVPDVDTPFVANLVAELNSDPAKIAIFQTGVGTHALFRATDSLGLTGNLLALLAQMVVVARGPKPTAALRSRGVRINLSAQEPYTTNEVLKALETVRVAGERVIVQRYGMTNAELEKALTARGARIVEIATYRWSLPDDTRPLLELIASLEQGRVDAVTFTSAAQVRNLFSIARQQGRADSLKAGLNRTLVASIGPVCSNALKQFGVAVGIEPHPPKLGPLVSALDQALSR